MGRVLRVAVVLLSMLSLQLFAQTKQPLVRAPHVPVAPLLKKRAPWPKPTVLQSAVGGLWMIDANFKSSLYIKNLLTTDPLTVTPILYLSNGQKFTLPDVALDPSGTSVVDINAGLNAQGIAPYATLTGYVEIDYKWPWSAICATVRNFDPVDSLVFSYGLQSTDNSADAMQQSPASQTPSAHVLEGMWWKQESGVTGFLAISNPTGQAIHAAVQVTDDQNNDLGDHSVTVSPYGTKQIDLDELLSTSSKNGGIRVTYDGPDQQILVYGGLKDQVVGYSANLLFGALPSDSAKVNEISYAELGLMTGAADSMMAFPTGTVFTPYSIVRNVSAQPVLVTPTLWWMDNGSARSAQLQQFAVSPHHTQSIDVPSLIFNAGLVNFNGSVNLVLDIQGQEGALQIAAGSVDQKNTYIFEVTPHAILQSASKSISYWSTGNGDDTMVTLWNPADEDQDFVFTLNFSGGHYLLPIHLAARATQMFNISQIIQNQIPDSEGNTIPAAVQDGNAELSGVGGESDQILVSVDSGTYNVKKATCWQGCQTCNGFVSVLPLISPVVIVSNSVQITMGVQYNTGQQYDRTTSSSWSSQNTGVATDGGGMVTGISAGATYLSALDNFSEPVYTNICNQYSPPCPVAFATPSGGASATVTPQITSISPNWGKQGGNTTVTISGSSFGTAPTVNPGSGITVSSYVSRTDTTVVAVFSIASNATEGLQGVTITNTTAPGGAQTSNSVNFQIIPTTATPVNFRLTNAVDAGTGNLTVTYQWDSSTGHIADLSGCTVGENVSYPTPPGVDYQPPSPPFPVGTYVNPTIDGQTGSGSTGGLVDQHRLTPGQTASSFVKPYSASSFVANQFYWYTCGGPTFVHLKDITITRVVVGNGSGGWEFRVNSSDTSTFAIINPLP